jgi:hypothetical protein
MVEELAFVRYEGLTVTNMNMADDHLDDGGSKLL